VAPPAGKTRIVAALHFATVAVYADLYITQPILPVLSREFGVAPAMAGLTVSAVVVVIAFVSSAYGSLSDRIGRKPVMVASCALLAVPTLLCAAAPGFRSLVLFRALQGLFIPGFTAIAVAYIGDLFAPGEVGPAVGGWIAASVTGGLVGRVLSGLIADAFGWRTSFIAFGALTLAGAVAIGRFLPGGSRARPEGVPSAPRRFGHLADRRLLGAFLIGGCCFFAFIGVFTYLPYYLSAPPFGLSTAAVSSVYLVYIAGVLASLATARLSRRVHGRILMATGLGVAACGVLGTLVKSLPCIVFSLVVLCVGMFVVQATTPAFVNLNASSAKGAASALYTTFYYVGATLGSVLPGFAWQHGAWPGVTLACVTALLVGLLADWLLCG
jgi:MFS transporter, YNFM family, putative membrane transport protein